MRAAFPTTLIKAAKHRARRTSPTTSISNSNRSESVQVALRVADPVSVAGQPRERFLDDIFGAVAIEGDRRGQPGPANLVLSEEAIDVESGVAVRSTARVLADHCTTKDPTSH